MTSRILAFGFIALLEFFVTGGSSFASLPELSEDLYAIPAPGSHAAEEIPGSFAAEEGTKAALEPAGTPIPSKPALGKITASSEDTKKAPRP